MTENAIKRTLQSGGCSFGTFVMEFNTPGIAAIIERTGAEFIVYDMEHSGFGTEAIRQLLSYNRGLQVMPFVRVPDTCYDFIARSLDAGARGIMAPIVESREQALRLVRAAKYPPRGARGATSNVAHDDFSGGDLAAKLESANRETLIFAQIETVAAIERIEEIVSVEGIDVAWVGHNDLSVSMGIPGQVTHPRVVAAMETVAAVCQKHGKTAGRLVPDVETGREWLSKGYRCLAYSNDIKALQGSLQHGINALKEHVAT